MKLSRWENKTFSKHQQIEVDSSSDEDEATGDTEQPDEMHGGDAEKKNNSEDGSQDEGTGSQDDGNDAASAQISTSSRGREVRRVNYRNLDHSHRDSVHGGSANVPILGATVETVESKYHEKRKRTPGQKQKFL